MVPMICLSGLIVDGSRVELAKATVSSAGDLTMNSALANYDTVLKDVYGLFAMSQTGDDLQDNLYNYFVDTLMANEIITSEDEVQSNPLLQDIAGAFSGKTSNMLSMEVAKEDFNATKLNGSSLANPSILKNQIVEYQKYRAPVSSALSLLDGIASIKKILEQNKVNEAKTTVDEKAGNLNKEAKSLYKKLEEYNKKLKEYNKISKEYDEKSLVDDPRFTTITYNGEQLTYKQAYEKYIIPEYVRKMAEDMPFSVYMDKDNNTGKFTFHFDIHYMEYTRGKNNILWTSYTGQTTDKLLEELKWAYEQFKESSIKEAGALLAKVENIDKLSLTEKKSYSNAYKSYMQKVYNLKNFYDAYKGQYNQEEDDVTFITEHEKDIIGIFENSVKYSKILYNYEVIVEIAYSNATNLMYKVNKSLVERIKWFSDINAILGDAINAIGEVEKKVSELDSANNNLKEEIANYDGSDAPDAFSKQMQSDCEYYKNNIDPKKVAELKGKLSSLQQYFSKAEIYLKSISFVGMPGSSGDSSSLYNLVIMTKNRTLTTGDINIDYINAHLADNLSGLINFYKTQYKEDSSPQHQNATIKNDEFYKYLHQAYSVKATDDDKAVENQKKDFNDKAKEANFDSKTNDYNKVSVSNEIKKLLPSQGNFIQPSGLKGYSGEDFSGLFDRISSAIEELIEGIKKAAKAGRDNLYVTQYIFDMFTYNTMKVEHEVECKEKEKNSDQVDKIETSTGIEKNSKNNYMYGSEIEYILYGGFDAKSNISSAKSTIFCIRFLANSSYALTNAEIRSNTLPPALAIQAATFGTVPYKLTQVILQLCLALCETANDIHLMEQGQKVALIKSPSTWTLSTRAAIENARDEITNEVTEEVQDIAGSAKGVMSKLIEGGTEKVKVKLDDYIEDMRIAVNNEVEKLIGSMFSAFEDEVISYLDSILKKGKSAVNNVEETATAIINSADEKAKSIINSSSDAVKPIIQKFYDDNISINLDKFKSEVKKALSSIDNLEDGSTILLNVQKEIAAMIENSLTNLTNYVRRNTYIIIEQLESKFTTTTDEYIDMAADKIINVTNEYLGKTFNSVAEQFPTIAGKKTNDSALSSILKFNYGDYLKMFVFLKLCINDENVLSRVADVIQLNVNEGLGDLEYTHPVKGNFLMSEAYTYIQLEAKVKLKTMFISLPFFTEYSKKSGDYFTINYKSVIGY